MGIKKSIINDYGAESHYWTPTYQTRYNLNRKEKTVEVKVVFECFLDQESYENNSKSLDRREFSFIMEKSEPITNFLLYEKAKDTLEEFKDAVDLL